MSIARDLPSISVKRPLLAAVLNLLIVIAGLGAIFGVEVRELPNIDRPIVTVRANFPGGFPGDARNSFSKHGRTTRENDIHSHVHRLLHLRREFPAITDGTMMHYAPTWHQDIYTYVRTHESERILVVANGRDEAQSVNLLDVMGGRITLRDLMRSDSTTHVHAKTVSLEPLEARVFEIVDGPAE